MDLARHALNNGHMQNMKFMTDKLKVMLGECTFLEAFERTGDRGRPGSHHTAAASCTRLTRVNL